MEQPTQELNHDFHPRNNLQALTSLPHGQRTLSRPSPKCCSSLLQRFVQLVFYFSANVIGFGFKRKNGKMQFVKFSRGNYQTGSSEA